MPRHISVTCADSGCKRKTPGQESWPWEQTRGIAQNGPMRAITIEQPGGPEVLRWTEVPDPVPADGEVLIEVHAAGVNRADLLQRQGLYPPPEGAPPYPGMEVSGRIVQVGSGAQHWHVGQDVCALISG